MDATSDLKIEGNHITDGVISPRNWGSGLISYSRNDFTFDVVLGANQAVMSGPGMLHQGVLTIEGNKIRSMVTQPSGATAISASYVDSNEVDYHYIQDNWIQGFSNGILTAGNGGNAGVPGIWEVKANHVTVTGTAISHTCTNCNEAYKEFPDNVNLLGQSVGAPTVNQTGTVALWTDCTHDRSTGCPARSHGARAHRAAITCFARPTAREELRNW